MKNETNLFTCREPISTYECFECPTFRTDFLTRLTLHIQSNHHDRPLKHKKRPYRCPQCGFSSHSTYLLIRHCLLENKRYDCQLCDYKSTQTSLLSLHIFSHHLKPPKRKKKFPNKNIRQVQCEYCSYKVRWSCELKSHVLAKHTPEEAYSWIKVSIAPRNYNKKKHILLI